MAERFQFRKLLKLPSIVRLSKQEEQEYRQEIRHHFTTFFRTAAFFGLIAYTLMILVDWLTAEAIFFDILVPRLTMQVLFLIAIAISFHKKFYLVAQYVGIFFFLMFMANIIWVQGLMEQKLEEGYGMLITPGVNSSIIVFSGAEVGYGALLTPLLLLPIAFSGVQALLTSALVIVGINYGMTQAELPDAFEETANSIFISLGIFTSILAFLVNQHRRSAFKLQSDLQQANSAKSNVLATMSHEVRTPLSGMLGMAALLEETQLDEKQKEYVQTFKYSGETLLAMLNDILDFSKMEAGKFEIETIDIDFNMLIKSVANLMRSRADEKGIGIKIEIDPIVPPYIHSDPTRLRQVLLNLLSNAIKFTDDGYVKVAVYHVGQNDEEVMLRFEVQDTGIGMTQEVMDRLFKEFSQADASTSRKYGGTGLGLSICQRIVELMGGEMSVRSEVGKGSAFSFGIAVGMAEAPVIESEETDDSVDISPQYILLVEDDPTIAKYTTTLLEKFRHKVLVAGTGRDALHAVLEESFDLIFMDYNLPDMKGSNIARELLRLGQHSDPIPIIGLTANTRQEIIDECYAAGMVDYMVKPIEKKRLMEILGKYGTVKDADEVAAFHDPEENSAITEMIKDFGIDYAKEIVSDFIADIESKQKTLSDALGEKDFDSIRSNAHDIASMTGTVGLKNSSELFRQIELSMFKDADVDINQLCAEAQKLYLQEKDQIYLLKDNA